MRDRLRILLTHVYSWPEVRRGGERYVHELGSALQQAGHQVRIVATAPDGYTDDVLGVQTRRLTRKTGNVARYHEHAPEVAFAREVLLRHAFDRIDVWHAFGTADAAAASFLSTLRRVPKMRSVYTDLGGPLRSYRAARPDHRLFKYAVDHLDAYLCLSESTRSLLQSDYYRRGLVVGGGVDLQRFTPGDRRAAEPTILFMSAADDTRKNLPLLLRAFHLVLQQRGDARLHLSGPGDPGPALAAASDAVREATVVSGVGAVGDIQRLYRNAWVTALPSTREAFGLVLVESLACGTPIVAIAESGGPAEIVKAGIGELAVDGSATALAVALVKTLAMAEGADTRAACRREAEAHYGWREAIVPRVEEVYRGRLTERAHT
ncbi:MAG: phosphatidyl-myo-inositol alpha-mannosyltransferase [Actinomycetota bacterium]|jgi:glycosyltransferase involved in cell wall biosynthesis